MTEKNGADPGEDELSAVELADAFAQRGELIPTTLAEVLRAEEDGVEHEGELPPGLAELRLPPESATKAKLDLEDESPEQPSSLADHRRRKSAFASHFLAAAIGAAAATALWVSREQRPEPGATVPTSEPQAPVADAARTEPRLMLPNVTTCSATCCAGSSCAAAKDELRQCSSGRKCVACSFDELAASRYRLRLGAFAPTEAGAKAVSSAGAAGLELCIRVGSSAPSCVPAHANANATEQWSLLPMVASAQDLLAGFVLEVRPRVPGAGPIGEWRSPVQLNATVMCRGLSLKPKTPKDESLGVVSVFLDDAHYVELLRAGSVSPLLAARRRFELGDVPAKLFETTAAGDQKFSLVLGPTDKPSAERLRWSVLEKGHDARLVIGEDHLGSPRPLD